MRIVLFAALVALAQCGCATLTKGTTQSGAIITPNVPGASCTLTSEATCSRTLVTPATVVV